MPGEKAATCFRGSGVRRDMDKTLKKQTLEELGREIFGPEFLKQCDDEYRRMQIVGSKYDRTWVTEQLPGWEFFRSDYCEILFVGSNIGLGLTVQGSSENEVQEAAAEAEQVLAEDTRD